MNQYFIWKLLFLFIVCGPFAAPGDDYDISVCPPQNRGRPGIIKLSQPWCTVVEKTLAQKQSVTLHITAIEDTTRYYEITIHSSGIRLLKAE